MRQQFGVPLPSREAGRQRASAWQWRWSNLWCPSGSAHSSGSVVDWDSSLGGPEPTGPREEPQLWCYACSRATGDKVVMGWE
eukprot:4220652-Prymnesium_polylepis.1